MERRSKFNVGKDKSDRTYDGIVFDSVLEMKYYRDYVLPKIETGEITYCERQKKYELQPSYIYQNKKVRPIDYKADFTLPKGLNDTWFILFYTNLYDNAVKIIGEDAKRICDEADKLIESKRKHLENKTELNVLLEKLSDKISSFGGQFSKDDISSIMKVIETLPNYTSENIIGAIAKEYEKIENKE